MTTTGPLVTDPELLALREKISAQYGRTPEELYAEREKRLRDVINLQEPDRVPIWITPDPCRFSGLAHSSAFYSPLDWKLSIRELTLALNPDFNIGAMCGPGSTWATLDVRNKLWPGGPLPADYEYQFVEGEYMKEDEYDRFLADPSDYIVRCYLPRIYGALGPLSNLPPLNQMFSSFDYMVDFFTCPDFMQFARKVAQAGRELKEYQQCMGDASEEMALLGYPEFSSFGGVGGAPFDTVSSFFRGMKGAFVDMFRQPEKLLQLCDRLLDLKIASAVPADPGKRGNPKRVAIPLWRGDRKFMSDKQFRKFYWPGLKKALQATIDLGFIPAPGFEATFGNRLECLLELPKGKVAPLVHYTDAKLAKEILKDHNCIICCAPPSLKYGSVQDAENYYQDLISANRKGGGFMINMDLPHNIPIEGARALVDKVKEYGRY